MAKKRGRRGDGSVYKSGKIWVAQVRKNGVVTRRKAKTRTLALKKLQELRSSKTNSPEGMRCDDWFERWLAEVERTRSFNTFDRYRYALKHVDWLRPRFIGQVTPLQLSDLISSCGSSHNRQKVHATLSRCFRRALEMGVLETNPMANLKRPAHQSEEPRPFEGDEVRAILQHVENHRMAGVFSLGLICGMRIGECLGLRWSDWNDDDTVSIVQVAKIVDGKVELGPPKTKASLRSVPIPKSVVDRFQDRRKLQLKEGLSSCELIFPSLRGTPMSAANFRNRSWYPTLRKLEIESRKFHHARHTAATHMLTDGVPVHAVGKVLGHSKPSITLDIYSHWIKQNDDQVRRSMQNAG